MNTSQKVTILKVSFILSYLLLIITAVNAWSCPGKEYAENPFSTEIIKYALHDNSCQVVHSGDARYELSHANFFLSRGSISNTSNSDGRPVEIIKWYHEPIGFKIDEFNDFGNAPDLTSFMVYLKLTPWESECIEELNCFAPIIAYKAATCFCEEQIESNCAVEDENDFVNTFPNPTCDYVHMKKKHWQREVSYTAELIGSFGKKVKRFHFSKRLARDFDMDLSDCKQGTYYLQI